MLHLHPHRHSHPGVAHALGVARARTATQSMGRRLVNDEKDEFTESNNISPVHRDGSSGRQLLEYIKNGIPNGGSISPPPSPITRISEPLLGRDNVAVAAQMGVTVSCKSEVSLITVAWADEFYSKKLDAMLDSWCGHSFSRRILESDAR